MKIRWFPIWATASVLAIAAISLTWWDANYNACMYPPFDGSVAGGITYVQVSGLFQYWFNDHFGVHARIAYVSLVSGDIRDAVDEYGAPYANDHVWGTIGVDIAF